MQIGMIGLGRMGGNMVRRLLRAGHECVVHDIHPESVAALVAEGATGAASLEEFTALLKPPRAAWIMLPAAIVGETVEQLAALMQADDVIIDGGNSRYTDAVDIAARLAPKGMHFVDVGTSGGVWGLDRGYCLMIGGNEKAVARLDPVFAALAPGGDGDTPAERGYLHCGPAGSGHFVKMVHNGIEYGMMAAYAEGMNLLKAANTGSQDHDVDAETTPLDHPEYYRFDLDVPKIAEVWRHGSVISSWLLDLTADALKDDPALETFSGHVSDSGEGRWTLDAAIDTAVPMPVLSAALFQRFSSRGQSDFADRTLSAMRLAFGGHLEKKT
ncbi:phosphogluconate dehydrogenase (NAD(+)-dependent, decarboxylating) [Oricola indica]|jgi:6-phosphogluconate dehydrogenase|uniref:phosphogluconate dehydrogenase (NAD(+)-dependent, decarboxylating) n=1 Tax=Oricola indica TaxID=2872591 RepID=UPI001CBD61E4|nr:decarboxylating 6-phosphogluconate dehydrogenase [Oricola indica]